MRTKYARLLSTVVAVAVLAAGCGGGSQAGPTVTSEPASIVTPVPTVTSEPAPEPGATVTVFFSSGDGADCGEVSPFTRQVAGNEPEIVNALTELLAGPTDAEIADGAGSFFSSETAVMLMVSLTRPGYTVIGFGDLASVIPNALTSCGSEALLAQLNQTVLQYVPRVRYEMLGSCQLFANWLQRECMEYTSEGAEPVVLTTLERASGSGCIPWESGVAPDVARDGDWFGTIESATDIEVEFDPACWFDGDAAIAAAAEDGEESPPPNDYYVRDADDAAKLIPVAADASVSWLPDAGDPTTETVVAFDEWVRLRESRPVQPGLWIEVRKNQVVEIREQFVP